MSNTKALLMLYVQQAVYEGLQPDEEGIYSIPRKEFLTRLNIPASTFDRNRDAFIEQYMKSWDLGISFGLKGLECEDLFLDVRYERGALKFRRNPITLRPELSYVWGIQPYDWERRRFAFPYIPVPPEIELPIKK